MELLEGLPIVRFESQAELRAWLSSNHASSRGVWIKVAKVGAREQTVSFEELLDEGLCFGWSESKRRTAGSNFYLQRFTPRKRPGTASQRNIARTKTLIAAGRMTPSGLKALGIE